MRYLLRLFTINDSDIFMSILGYLEKGIVLFKTFNKYVDSLATDSSDTNLE